MASLRAWEGKGPVFDVKRVPEEEVQLQQMAVLENPPVQPLVNGPSVHPQLLKV